MTRRELGGGEDAGKGRKAEKKERGSRSPGMTWVVFLLLLPYLAVA